MSLHLQEETLEAQQKQVSHYHVIRDAHLSMQQSILSTRKYLTDGQHEPFSPEFVETSNKQLDLLEQVLEFSATWEGVEAKVFFDETPELIAYLRDNNLLRLKHFFLDKPFAEISRGLRELGIEYPPILKKLYEEYYLRKVERGANHHFRE